MAKYSKSLLKKAVKHAYKMKSETKYTDVAFQIYANSIYILDTEEDNVIEICRTEQEAIECCEGIDEESGQKNSVYYKPILIDKDSGERITRTNLNQYKN